MSFSAVVTRRKFVYTQKKSKELVHYRKIKQTDLIVTQNVKLNLEIICVFKLESHFGTYRSGFMHFA